MQKVLAGDGFLPLVTFAALASLVIINYRGASEFLRALGGATVDYVRAIQGR
jgi:hypothetical protein